jgi:hypothetical protein
MQRGTRNGYGLKESNAGASGAITVAQGKRGYRAESLLVT